MAISKLTSCQVCGRRELEVLLNFGNQPICTRLGANTSNQEKTHPLVLGQCTACGLIQLMNHFPPEDLIAIDTDVTWAEPEAHLDEMVELILGLPNITRESEIVGLTVKEETTLARIRRKGYENVWKLDQLGDFGITNYKAGVETLQKAFTPLLVSQLRKKRVAPDVVIVRHFVEHAQELPLLLQALHDFVKPRGYIVIEVPDCTKCIRNYDYSMVWEEHTLYFTPTTLKSALRQCNFSIVEEMIYPSTYEDNIALIAQPTSLSDGQRGETSIDKEPEREKAKRYSDGYTNRREALVKYLTELRSQPQKLVIYGSGHVSCAYINLMRINKLIDFVVDDDVEKQGLYMPGSRLEIRSSNALYEKDLRICFLGLNRESEETVVNKHRNFLNTGGRFFSVHPSSIGEMFTKVR